MAADFARCWPLAVTIAERERQCSGGVVSLAAYRALVAVRHDLSGRGLVEAQWEFLMHEAHREAAKEAAEAYARRRTARSRRLAGDAREPAQV